MAGGIGDILQNNIQRRFQPRQKLADALMQGAYDTSPVTSPWEALGRIAQGGIAGYAGRRVRDKETEAQKAATDTLSRALMGDNVDYNILGGNQDTAGLGLDLKINDQFSVGLFAQMDRDSENEVEQKFLGTEIRFNFPAFSAAH